MTSNNIISIDYEDWYHGLTSTSKESEKWHLMESRIKITTDILLSLFKKYDIKATFFVLGIIAEKHPELIQNIYENGHEIGIHTYKHSSVKNMTQEEFEIDLENCINAIRKATPDVTPIGFRAPYFSVTDDMPWFYESLSKYGFKYDSSVFPLKTPLYGIKNADRFRYDVTTAYGKIIEFPITTYNFYNTRLPMAGGFYFRLLPVKLVKYFISRVNRDEGREAVMYFHPWEFDPLHPYRPQSLREKISHYHGLKSSLKKLDYLLKNVNFSSFENYLSS